MPALRPGSVVTGSDTWTASAAFKALATSRACTVTIYWWQPSGAASAIKASSTSAPVNDSTTTWTVASVTDSAPSDAAYASVGVSVAGCGASEQHAVDEVGLFAGAPGAWARGGLAGLTTVTVWAQDAAGGYYTTPTIVRGCNAVPIPWPVQSQTFTDWETTPGVQRSYWATVHAVVGGVSITSAPSATATITINTTGSWYAIVPTNTALNMPISVATFSITQVEQSAAHYAMGVSLPTVATDVVNGRDGSLQVKTFSAADLAALEAIATGQVAVWLTSPYGLSGYFYLGLQPGGMSSGYGNPVRQSALQPGSVATAPVTFHTVTCVEIQAPIGSNAA